MEGFELLSALCDSPGVSGQDGTLSVAESYLKSLGEVSRDATGSLVCTIGRGEHRVMLDAHIDEIGFLVTAVDGDFLRVAKCGGIDPRTVIDQDVVVYGKDPLFGVFASLPPHLKKEEDKAPQMDELIIDCGLPHEELVNLVTPGDRVGFKAPLARLANGRVTGKSLDNRAGVAAVLMAASRIDTQKANCTLIVSLSAQEELGLRGARTSAFAQEPDEAIVVDVSFGDGPDISPRECGKLGDGPMIGMSPILDTESTKKMIWLAEKLGMPYQLEVMGGTTGTNADVISVSKTGVRTTLLSIPLRNMHTACEAADRSDIEAVARLIAEYVRNGGGRND